MADKWTPQDIPDQSGRVAVVTGANVGLGLVAARELARKGAHVILACRNPRRGEEGLAQLRAAVPEADAELAALDLSDLSSVRAFTESFSAEHDGLDLLINNAGIMAVPRAVSVDGFESQLATNHLGPFALTGLLLAALQARDGRVVTVSSLMHRIGKIDFDDLMGERSYGRWGAYAQSKLANLLFTFELERRARAAGLGLHAMAAHPGVSATNLFTAGQRSLADRMMAPVNYRFAQSAEIGALPELYAATVTDLPGGCYVGPNGFMEQRGHPKLVQARSAAYDPDLARRLWEVSEELTGVSYAFADVARSTHA